MFQSLIGTVQQARTKKRNLASSIVSITHRYGSTQRKLFINRVYGAAQCFNHS